MVQLLHKKIPHSHVLVAPLKIFPYVCDRVKMEPQELQGCL